MTLDDEQRQLVDRLAGLDLGHRSRRGRRSSASHGLYVHGSAGRGKTWLVGSYFDSAPTRSKVRFHFHSFFVELHRRIHAHRDDPAALRRAIDELIGPGELLFFDELHVHDPADARLLTRLLEYVLSRRITVLATSNYAPDDLLPNPIWHHLFEPGIALITSHLEVHHLAGNTDYRGVGRHDRSAGFAASVWTTALSERDLPKPAEQMTLTVVNRSFPVLAAADGRLWVSFAQLCEAPLSTTEYLHWAHTFTAWVITAIPTFDEADREARQRFINLIDILVDADVAVTFSSSHTLTAFVSSATTQPDAFRMISRMQLVDQAL